SSRREMLKATAASMAGISGFVSSTPVAPSQTRPSSRASVKMTKRETFLVKPRWLFLKVHTNVGGVGLGEPITEGRALTCATAVKEIEPYLVGKDPRAGEPHWQGIYSHACL